MIHPSTTQQGKNIMNKELLIEVCEHYGIDALNALAYPAFVRAVERAYNKGGFKAVHKVISNFNF